MPESFLTKRVGCERKEKRLPGHLSLKDKVEAFEKIEIEKAMKLSRNLVEVSDFLGISRQVLQYKMKKYDLK